MATVFHITYRNQTLPVTFGVEYQLAEKAVTSNTFQTWLRTMESQSHLAVLSLHIQSVDMFGPKVGFIKFATDVADSRTGKTSKHFVFMRSDAVAILVVLRVHQERYTILTVQSRIPVGSESFMEIPAGMLDDSKSFVGVAAKELKEETGIDITEKELIPLGAMTPSAGGCNEHIKLYLYEKDCDKDFVRDLASRTTGVLEEGESITLKVVRLDDVTDYTDDAKAQCALYRYMLMFKGQSPPCRVS